MKAVRYAGAGGEIWLPAKYLYNVSFNTIHRLDHCIGKICIPVRFKNTKSVLFVTFMQRERHEKGILRRPQPGLDHKTSLCEQKSGSKNPVNQKDCHFQTSVDKHSEPTLSLYIFNRDLGNCACKLNKG